MGNLSKFAANMTFNKGRGGGHFSSGGVFSEQFLLTYSLWVRWLFPLFYPFTYSIAAAHISDIVGFLSISSNGTRLFCVCHFCQKGKFLLLSDFTGSINLLTTVEDIESSDTVTGCVVVSLVSDLKAFDTMVNMECTKAVGVGAYVHFPFRSRPIWCRPVQSLCMLPSSL